MKKILLVTRPIAPPWDEGSKNFAYFLAKNLTGDLEVNLMGTSRDLPELGKNVKKHPVYTTSEIADFNLEQKMRSLFFQFQNRGKFDVNHYFFTPTKLNSFLIKYLLKSSKTKTVQTVATLREDLWSDRDLKKLMFADLIVTYSDYSRKKLKDLGFENVKRIYPGIDLEEYKKEEKSEELLKKCNFSSSDFIINFTGEYVRLGAIDAVIDSFVGISQKVPEARLSLAVRIKSKEDARKKKEIVEKLKRENLLEKTAFHDDGNYRMADIYNLCDVSVFPVENMRGKFDVPLAVIEAMACQKPVILSDIPILKEFANEKNSATIEKSDVSALTETVLNLYENPEKREEIGKEARAYAEDNFDIRKVADEYKKIYEEL